MKILWCETMHDSVKAHRHDSEVVSMHKDHSSDVHVGTYIMYVEMQSYCDFIK